MMDSIDAESIDQMISLTDQLDGRLKTSFEILHQGYPRETLERFLKARDGNVQKAHRMLIDCLNWRVQNEIDDILSRPIEPVELYKRVRESQLMGMTGYCKKGRPIFALGVGLSAYDKAPVDKYIRSHIQMNEYRDQVLLPMVTKELGTYIGPCLKILDMTGLKLSALNRLKILTMISTVDDLNYPEKTETYYIVNAPYVFSACWKVVKPLLQERTRKKVQVLNGNGRDELLKVMDYDCLPHFSRQQGSGSSRRSNGETSCCFAFEHQFHQELYNYMKNKASERITNGFIRVTSFHVDVPEEDPDGKMIVQTIEHTLQEMSKEEDVANGVSCLRLSSQQSDVSDQLPA